jgi:hypothetical protein
VSCIGRASARAPFSRPSLGIAMAQASASNSSAPDQARPSFCSQASTSSPLLMSAATRPSIMKVGVAWMPFWRILIVSWSSLAHSSRASSLANARAENGQVGKRRVTDPAAAQ